MNLHFIQIFKILAPRSIIDIPNISNIMQTLYPGKQFKQILLQAVSRHVLAGLSWDSVF